MATGRHHNVKRKLFGVDNQPDHEEAGSSIVDTTPIVSTAMASPPEKLKKLEEYDQKLVYRLSEIFSETCQDYIKQLCYGKQRKDFDELVEMILANPDRPKRKIKQVSPPPKISREEQLQIVKEILPDADPTFLKKQCERLKYDHKIIAEFIEVCRKNRAYPKMKEYPRQQLTAQLEQYTKNFDIERFIELFPDPEKTFSDPTRKLELTDSTKKYIQTFFENKFNKLYSRNIADILFENKYNILKTDKCLQDLLDKNITMKSKRKVVRMKQTEHNILVLQELAYVKHKDDILHHIEMKENELKQKRQYAKDNGLMNTCACCFNDELIPDETYYCPKDHPFCRECIETSCGIALGEGQTKFRCLADCTEEFPLTTLQKVLPPKMFSSLTQKQALAEVKAAGLNNLEMCPFCDFAGIQSPQDKVFRCLNPECMKESCRKCKEPSHLPLRCDEVEKDEQVKARIHLENKMTEALLRKCYRCGTSFFKEEGCNKMTCPCGAITCYICNAPVKGYKHFNGIGGDRFDLCPLYSDTNEFNKNQVLQAAQNAKQEIKSDLKVDPSVDIQQHFQERRRVLGTPPYLQQLQNLRANIPPI